MTARLCSASAVRLAAKPARRRILFLTFIATFLLMQGCQKKCEGDAAREVDQLIQDFAVATVNCVVANNSELTATWNCALNVAMTIDARRAKLSKACQKLFDDKLAQISKPTGSGSQVMCVGGVCCDSTGCYD